MRASVRVLLTLCTVQTLISPTYEWLWGSRRRRSCSPRDCIFSSWSPKSACSKTCGDGTQVWGRRVVTSASCGGSCNGALSKTMVCNLQCCPVDCVFTWGVWGACSATCGNSGTQNRPVSVTTAAACGGKACSRPAVRNCPNTCCPVNCHVGSWGSWGACNARCGQTGYKTRTRSITTRPSCNGVACPSLSERATCAGPCCPVNCVVSSWGAWTRCNAPAGQCGTNSGTRTRRRVVQKQNSCGGTSCPQLSETRRCTPVKITCQVSSWGAWSSCSPSNGKCGAGSRTRRRTIVRHPYCSGACPALSETGRCTHSCCPVNCVVGSWSAWGACSATCGAGRKTRSRRVTINNSCNGRACPALVESTSCTRYNNRDCVMNGWSRWSACSTGCGKGRATRTRSVRTTPLCRGRPCPSTVEAKDCYSYRENRDCVVSAWGSWGACSEKCAVGSRQRTRTVQVTQRCRGRACPTLRDSSQCGVANNACQHVCNNGACACNAGYYLAPDRKKCYAKNCGTASLKYCAPGTSLGTTCKHANVSCPGGSTLFPVTCSLGCPQFYSIRGASLITCQSSGKWTSYSASYCRRDNDPPTGIPISGSSISENLPRGSRVGTLSSLDPNAKDKHTYRLISAPSGSFEIRGNALYTLRVFDYESSQKRFSIVVRSTDNGRPAMYLDKTFTISVTDVNEAPTAVQISTATVNENSAQDTTVGVLNTVDPDSGQTHTYTLLDSAGGRFKLQGNSLKVAQPNTNCLAQGGSACLLNYENQRYHNIRVSSVDSGSPRKSVTQTLRITVVNTNDQPRDLSLSNNTVTENAPLNFVIGTFTARDEDTSQQLAFSLVDSDDGRFKVDSQGRLLKANETDYETNIVHYVTATVRDNGSPSMSISKRFAIEVLNVNEPPVSIMLSTAVVQENSSRGTSVGTLIAVDKDAVQTLTFNMDDSTGGKFALDKNQTCTNSTSGGTWCQTRLLVNATLNFEQAQSHSITVRVSDDKGLFRTQQFIVRVTDVNDAPTDITLSGSSTAQVNENTRDAVIGDFKTTDEDTNQTHSYTLISNGVGNFEVRGNKLYVSKSASLNYESVKSYSIVVRSTDSGRPSKYVEKPIRINIGDVNEQPTAITLSNTTVDENTPAGTMIGSLSITDPDARQTHTCSLVDSAGRRLGITNSGSIQLTVGIAGVNYEDRVNVSIRVRCVDQGGLALAKTFVIRVSDVNEAPTAVRLSSGNVRENQRAGMQVGTLSAVDPDNANSQKQSFVYSLVSSSVSLPFKVKKNVILTTRRLDYENVPQWNIQVKVQDSGTPVKSLTQSFTIQVQDANDPPDGIVLSNSVVEENSQGGATVGVFTARDQDTMQNHTFRLVDSAGGKFSVRGNTLQVGLVNANCLSLGGSNCDLNYEKQPQYVVTAEVQDNGAPPLTYRKNFTITLRDINDRPRNLQLSNNRVPENASVNTFIGRLTATDEDTQQIQRFSLTDDDGGRFRVDIVGRLYKAKPTNYETQKRHVITANVTDNGSPALSIEKSFIIEVINVNESPFNMTFTSQDSQTQFPTNAPSVKENSPVDTVVGTVIVYDQDANQNVRWSLDDGGSGVFNYSHGPCSQVSNFVGYRTKCTIIVRVIGMLDHERRADYSVAIKALDNGGQSVEKQYKISVTDVNEAPSNITLSGNQVGENINGALVGELGTIDQDYAQTHTYQLVDDAAGKFVVRANKLYVSSAAYLDFEAQSLYTVVVKSTDSGVPSHSVQVHFTIRVFDINEAPTNITISNSHVTENSQSGTTIGTLNVSDPDKRQRHTCQLTGNQIGQFIIIGWQLVVGNAILNFEQMSSTSVGIICTDFGLPPSLSLQKALTIKVDDVNESPTALSLSSNTIAENQSPSVLGTFSTSDPDNENQAVERQKFTYILMSSAGLPFVIDGDALNTTRTLDYETTPSWNITVKSQDSGNPPLSIMSTFQITVADVNESPFNIRISNSKIDENSNQDVVVGSLTCQDPDVAQTPTFTLIDGASGRFKLSNGRIKSAIANTACLNIGGDNCKLNYEKQSDYVIRVRSTDNGFPPQSTEANLTIRLNDVNDRPRDLKLSNQNVKENATVNTFIGKFSARDEDDGQVLSFSLVDDDSGRFRVDSSGNLYKAKSMDYETNTKHTITAQVKDNGTTPLELNKTFTIVVENINEAPVNITFTSEGGQQTFPDNSPAINENSPTGTPVGTLVSLDHDAVQTLRFTLDDDASGRFSIQPSATCHNKTNIPGVKTVCSTVLRVSGALDSEENAKEDIIVRVTDNNGLFHTQLFTVRILDINDRPTNITLAGGDIGYVDENRNNALVGELVTSDEDVTQSHTYRLVSDGGLKFRVIGDRVYTSSAANLNYEKKSKYNIIVRTIDSGTPSLHLDKSFAIQILDINERPTDIILSGSSVNENSAHGTRVGNLSVVDPDNNGPRGPWQLHYCLMVNSVSTKFIVNSTTHNVLVAGELDFEKSPSYDVTISCFDNGVPQLSFAKTFALSIRDLNERPTRIFLSNNVVEENSGIISVGKLTTADPDNAKIVVQSFTYTLVNQVHNSLPFVIDGDVLNTTKSLDYEARSTWVVSVKSTDNKGLSVKMNFSIAVTDSNDAPTGIVVSGPQKLSEDSAVGTYVATLATTDQDVRQTHTYSIIEVAASNQYGASTVRNHGNLTTQFSVESPSGLVALSRADLNYEEYCNYTITVNSTDSGFPPHSVSDSFVVMVTDVHEPPSDVILTNNKIQENSRAGTVVGSFSVYDPDNFNVQWQSHLCVITNSIAVPFKVVNQTTLAVAKNELNYEKRSLYSLNVTCSEVLDTNFSISRTFFVNVLDVNEPPFNLSISSNVVLENQQAGAQVGSLTASDSDGLNSGTADISFSIVSQAPSTGMFSLSNSSLVTTAPLDYERQRTYNLTFVARDSGSPTLSTRLSLTIQVLDDNDAPSAVVLNQSQIYENSANGSLVGVLETVDQDSGQTHSYTLVDRQDLFIIRGSELLATPLDYEVESVVNITVSSTDDGLPPRSTETVLMVTILDRNDPPSGIDVQSLYKSHNNSLSTAGVITIEENSPSNMLLANLTVVDQDLGQQHTWMLLNGSEFFHVQPLDTNSSTLLVKQGAVLDYETHRDRHITVIIQCTDTGNPPYSVSIIQYVALTDVNEVPVNFSYSGQLTVMENSKNGAVIAGRFSCQRWDPEKNECIFEVIGKYAEVFKVNKNKSLEVINSTWLDYEAITPPAILDVTINATDTGVPPPRWLSRIIHIAVLDTNEPPSDIRIEQSSVPENVSIGYCLKISCENPESYQKINFTLLSTFNGTFKLQDRCENSTRGRNSVFLIVATNLNYDITRDYDFRIALDDGYGGKLIELISLNITRVDPCPHVTECHVNATCNRINGREHVCLCRLGYAGDGYHNCTNIDECLPNPCKFGGVCNDRLHNYTCDCPTGYQTSYSFLPLPHCPDSPMGGCETYLPQCEEINDCNPNPCNNVGSCVDALNNYTCFCAAGFKGRNCSVNIDECAPHPCGERGDCTDSINSFTCHCNEGYMGTLCQRQKEDCNPDPCVEHDQVCVRPDIRYKPRPQLCISNNFVITLQFSPKVFTTNQVASPTWKFKLQDFFESYLIIPVSEMTLEASDNNTAQVSDVIFLETGAIDDSDNQEHIEVKFVVKTSESVRVDFKLNSAFIPRNGFFRALNRTCQFIKENESFEFHICQAVFARIKKIEVPSQQTFGPDTAAIAQKNHRSTMNPLLYYVGGALCVLFLIILLVAVAMSGRNAIRSKRRRHLKHEKFVTKGTDELFTDVLQRHQLAHEGGRHTIGNVNPMYGEDEEEILATVHMQDNPLYQSPMQDSNLPEEMQYGVEFENPMYQSFKEIDGHAGQSEC